ncbi:MAG TPA: hypothetical protein DCP02_01730 [Actinobacteria bacterium]|nr:hypothetical protein [Actinomycetota bacterium]
MLGAVAAGDFEDINGALDSFIKVRKSIDPEKKQVDYFKEKFEVYKNIYSSVKDFNHYLD